MMEKMYELCGKVKVGFAHNAKFDLHAINNVYKKYPHKNILDTMSIARIVLPAIPIDAGGDSLALKSLADKYIEKDSSTEMLNIKKIRRVMEADLRNELEGKIANAGFDKKKYSKVYLSQLAADAVLDMSKIIPTKVYQIWKEWDEKHPKIKGLDDRISYKDVYESSKYAKELMEKYAFNDVIYTLEIARKFYEFVKLSDQVSVLYSEQQAMYALWESERIGIKIDKAYIAQSKARMIDYINQKISQLQGLLDARIEASVFAASPLQIKKWLNEEQKMNQESTSKAELEALCEKTDNENVKKVLSLVIEIRKLIKKFSTDLLGFEENEWNGRRYTVFNQNGAVTGRLSNDMQQMPNEGICDDKGTELFHPRKAVITSTEEGFPWIAYLDYSQVEVRLQAHYTWIATKGKGDVNLLRMFVPFNCQLEDRTKWNPTDPKHVNEKFINENNWTQIEDGKPWEITDFHLLTARTAFPHIKDKPKDDPEVQKLRKKAKGVNFATQYGAGLDKIIDLIGDAEDATKLFEANKTAFPGVVAYGNMLKKEFFNKGYVENAYGRKYKTKAYTHKLNNYVIQGSGAEILKRKMVSVAKYLADKKSRLIHNIHDEVQIEIHKDEYNIITELKEIMQDVENKFVVPIVSDIEITSTKWYDKEEVC